MRIKYVILLVVGVAVVGCSKLLPGGPASEDTIAEPTEGLTQEQMKMFVTGDELFAQVFTPADGVGPVFIQTACEGCHIGDGKGHPLNTEKRFGKKTDTGFDYLENLGGLQLQHRAVEGYLPEVIPAEATHTTERLAPIVIGMGRLAAVHDSVLLNLADPFDANGDGISGRINYIAPKEYHVTEDIHIDSAGYFIGRFGKKAKEITLLDQVVFALKQDMGLTSDYDVEDLYNPIVGMYTYDDVPDPEVGTDIVQALVFYMRTLKAPTRRNIDSEGVIAGEQVFKDVGCVKCHVQNLTTAETDIAAISEIDFQPYTDLLLHDMGSGLDDGFPEGNAKGFEWRTPPLWGLGLADDSQGGTGYYLHDGRAQTLEEAISFHGGEASGVIGNYLNLSETDQANLMEFLNSL